MASSALLALLLFAPQGNPSQPTPVVDGSYRIGPEDVVVVSVWQNAELSRTVPVRPDGKISLPLVNEVQAAGLTPLELRQSIMEKLSEYMPGAEVSVVLSEINSFRVSVLGEVKKPERYRLRGPATVLDVLAMAGGLQEWAKSTQIVVMRPNREMRTFARLPFNYRKVTTAGGESGNFLLQPDDIVVVP